MSLLINVKDKVYFKLFEISNNISYFKFDIFVVSVDINSKLYIIFYNVSYYKFC